MDIRSNSISKITNQNRQNYIRYNEHWRSIYLDYKRLNRFFLILRIFIIFI